MILRIGFYIITTVILILGLLGKIEIDKVILMMVYWLFCYELFKNKED